MKRFLSLILLILSLSLLISCGTVSDINLSFGSSELYTEKEIRSAMNEVVRHFSLNFKGCDLTDLWYDEDFSLKQADDWAEQYQADEAIVLLSNFDVDESGGDGSLNPNSTYANWMWILVRDNGGWELKTWGY